MAAPQQGVIERFTNEGEGWLGQLAKNGYVFTYTGGIVAGKAEGRGTVRCEGGGEWALRDAEFRGGRMVACRAVFARDDGDAYAGPLIPATLRPPNGAHGAIVRGKDGGVFQGDWSADGEVHLFRPHGGAAVVFPGGSVHRLTLRGKWRIDSDGDGWGPGKDGWGPAVCVMVRPTADEVHIPPPPARPPPRGR
jgi:hypothetical protein